MVFFPQNCNLLARESEKLLGKCSENNSQGVAVPININEISKPVLSAYL